MEYTDEQIIAAIDAAPVPVQETLRSSDTNKVLADIGAAHNLHIDQIGDLAEINRNLLIGLVAPAEMYGELVQIGVSADEARQIMSEINTKIFVPLREKMRNSTEGSQTTASVPLPKPAPVPVPQAQPLPQYSTAPLQQEQAARSVSGSASPVAAPVLASPPPHTQVFTSTGGWPGAPAGNWQPAAAVHVYVPGPAPMHTPVPATAPPEQHTYTPPLPQTYQPLPQPAATASRPETPVRTVRPVPAPPDNLPGASPEPPLEKNYVADPYREPM